MAINKYSDGNGVVAEVLDKRFGLSVGERTSITGHPVLQAGYLGDLAGSTSGVKSKSLTDLGLGVMAATAEDTAVTPKAFGFEKLSATVAIQREARRTSNFLEALTAEGLIRDPVKMAYHATQIYLNTFLALVCTNGATFSQDVSPGSAKDMDWATIRAAKRAIEGKGVNVNAGLVCILEHKVWGELEDGIAVGNSMSDAYVNQAAAGGIFDARAMGWQGRYFGIDFFTTSRVPKANSDADFRGCMFASGGIVWADAHIQPDPDAHQYLLDGGKLELEFARDPAKWAREVYFNAPLGVAKGIDKCGVTLTSQVA